LWELREIRAHLKAAGRSASAESELFEAMEQQREIHKAAAAKSKAARRKIARIPDAPAVPAQTVDYTEAVEPLSASEGVVK
jgi:putative transposase